MVAAADDSVSDERVATIERSACPTCGSCSGMFTANSMNCLTEALGLALPGNGSTLATHSDRERLFVEAGHLIVDLAKRYYEQNDESVLPRAIASFGAFENAMTLDIAMGGSTNTVLHLLAAAYEGQVEFSMADIDRLSRRVPVLCKVAPSVANIHMEDVHRAGGIMAILGELERGGPHQLDAPDRAQQDHGRGAGSLGHHPHQQRERAHLLPRRARAACRRRRPSARAAATTSWTPTAQKGCIRDAEHAYSKDGGLAVLFGNLALDGCIVKTAGVDASNLVFAGPARVYESQDAAVDGILNGKVKAGDVVVIRYEGPRGGPGMQEMLYPTSYLKSKGLGKACALVTDGRFSGGTSGLPSATARRKRPRAALIGLVEEGDRDRDRHPEPPDRGRWSPTTCFAERRAAMEAKGTARLEARRAAQAQGHHGAARLRRAHHLRRQGRRAGGAGRGVRSDTRFGPPEPQARPLPRRSEAAVRQPRRIPGESLGRKPRRLVHECAPVRVRAQSPGSPSLALRASGRG